MNESRFDTLMRSVDDGLLEEAETPRKNNRTWKMIAYAAVAACVCVAAVGMLTHPKVPRRRADGKPGAGGHRSPDNPAGLLAAAAG
jgi:negative regulator of sigma E activity